MPHCRLRKARRLEAVGVALSSVLLLFAAASPASSEATPDAALRAEMTRGATEISRITQHRDSYGAIHQLIRQCLERNAQQGSGTFGFLIGAHAAAALWLRRLPPDVAWREAAVGRHLGIIMQLLTRTGLGADEVARLVARATGSGPSAQKWLVDMLRAPSTSEHTGTESPQ